MPLDEHHSVEEAVAVAPEDSSGLPAGVNSSETEQQPTAAEVEKVAEAAAEESLPAPEV